MRELSELKAFEQEFNIVHLPASRLIGKEIRSGGPLGNMAPSLWDEIYSTKIHLTLNEIPNKIFKDLLGWTSEYDSKTDTFLYFVCVLTLPDTPVPDGFIYRDVPETSCAIGLFGEDVKRTIERANELGYQTNWEQEHCGWNAELSFHEEELNPPRQNCTPWHWMIPVTNKKK